MAREATGGLASLQAMCREKLRDSDVSVSNRDASRDARNSENASDIASARTARHVEIASDSDVARVVRDGKHPMISTLSGRDGVTP